MKSISSSWVASNVDAWYKIKISNNLLLKCIHSRGSTCRLDFFQLKRKNINKRTIKIIEKQPHHSHCRTWWKWNLFLYFYTHRSPGYVGYSNFNALFTPLTFLASYFNSGVNPLLYAILSRNFRKGMSELLICSLKSKSKTLNKRAVTHVSKINNSTIITQANGEENNVVITEKDVAQLNGTIAEYDSCNDYVET